MNSRVMIRTIPSFLLALGILLSVGGAAAVERDAAAPEPVNHGLGQSIGEADMAAPYVPGTKERDELRLDESAAASLRDAVIREKILKDDDIGGDDEIISSSDYHRMCDIDIASNGDIYVALMTGDLFGEDGADIWVYRSQDGGDSWQNWGRFYNSETYGDLEDPCLLVAEGDVERCYLAYRDWEPSYPDGVINVAYSDLSSEAGDWTIHTVMDVEGVSFSKPDLASDVDAYDEFYLYLVADGDDRVGRDIWYSRSVIRGGAWEAPYRIAELATDDRGYHDPSVSYGYGGFVHVAWHFEMNDDSLDDAIRYRRCSSYGSGGIAGWDAIQYLTLNTNDKWESYPVVRAAHDNYAVMIVSSTAVDVYYTSDPTQLYSSDQGATFPYQAQIAGGLIFPEKIDRTSTGDWVLGGSASYPWAPGIQRASAAAPTTWSAEKEFVDDWSASGTVWSSTTALDPSRGDRAAAVWVDLGQDDVPNMLKFDAEWRGDAGYPNLMAGFPVDLDHQPISPPAIVDLAGDGYPEIVYGDYAGRIHAWRFDGTESPGFPVDTGRSLSDGPVAVGALTPGGRNFVVAGTEDGWVFAYEADGTLADGWPVELLSADPVYVSLGALGAPSVRTVIACYGNRFTYLDYRGSKPADMYGWYHPTRTFTTPAAIGDIDGDGSNEVLVAADNVVVAYDPRVPASKMSFACSSLITDQITLGDLDLDGDVEIFVPTFDGTMYGLQHDGTSLYPALPFTAPSATPLTSVAIASHLGTYEPELVVAARNYTVHQFYGHSGEETLSSPLSTSTGWFLFGAPIIGRVESTASDILIGDRGARGWAWNGVGQLIPGWPEEIGGQCQLSPAIGDLNADGAGDVAFLTLDQLVVYELNQGLTDGHREWPMYGYGPERTGCADCPEDLVTPVQEGGPAITSVAFAPPSPNPMAGQGTFRFSVPIRAAASLEIFDLRGRLVRTVLREEVELGERAVTWNGRDADGHQVAAGQYLARLRVRGPGVSEEMVRKLVVLR